MENNGIRIVDRGRGRGPQLSTCRVTVQDLVPYLRQNFTNEQILEIMPVLSVGEIQAVQRYAQANFESVMQQDQRIRQRNEARQLPPDVEAAQRQERLQRLDAARRQIRQQKQEQRRDPAAG